MQPGSCLCCSSKYLQEACALVLVGTIMTNHHACHSAMASRQLFERPFRWEERSIQDLPLAAGPRSECKALNASLLESRCLQIEGYFNPYFWEQWTPDCASDHVSLGRTGTVDLVQRPAKVKTCPLFGLILSTVPEIKGFCNVKGSKGLEGLGFGSCGTVH